MSYKVFEDDCADCRPCLLDLNTGKPLPDDSAIMRIVNEVWDHQTTLEERKAFHDVSCNNSREPTDMHHFHAISERIQSACRKKLGN